MTVYARGDVMGVSVSKDHGGCGATHSRPVTHGAPAKVWALDCHPCENHLRSDPVWSTNTAEIPETPDETTQREQNEKRGERGYAANLEASVASLAASQEGMQKLLAIMISSQAATNPAVANALVALTGGAPLAPTVVDEAADAAQAAAVAQATGDMSSINEERVTMGLEPFDLVGPQGFHSADGLTVLKSAAQTDLSSLKLPELRALAKDRGLDATGTRAELTARLKVKE